MNEKRIKQKNEKVEAAWQRIKDLAPEPLYLALRKFASCFDGTEICECKAVKVAKNKGSLETITIKRRHYNYM